jgi:hypothetical protein
MPSRTRDISLVLLTVHLLGVVTGCTSSVTISPREAQLLGAGPRIVHTPTGEEEKVGAEYSVELIPRPGWVLMRKAPRAAQVIAVEEQLVDAARDKGWILLEPIEGPVEASLKGPTLSVGGPYDQVLAPQDKVDAVRVRHNQRSSGASPGIAIGVVAGVVLIGVAIGFGVALSSWSSFR